MATHSGILACGIPQRSPWVRKESDTTEQLNAFIFPGDLVVDSTLPLQGAQFPDPWSGN